MLILPEQQETQKRMLERNALVNHYNAEMEKILNANSTKEKYWILGKVRFPSEFEGKVGRTFLQACDEKPPLVRNAFLYEVDNQRGVKTLLWVMHPDNSLRLPTLGKTLRVSQTQTGEKQVVAA